MGFVALGCRIPFQSCPALRQLKLETASGPAGWGMKSCAMTLLSLSLARHGTARHGTAALHSSIPEMPEAHPSSPSPAGHRGHGQSHQRGRALSVVPTPLALGTFGHSIPCSCSGRAGCCLPLRGVPITPFPGTL